MPLSKRTLWRAVAVAATLAGLSASRAENAVPTVPGNVGDLQYFNENDGRVGKRNGAYGALGSKYALGYTFAQDWWIGAAGFTAWNSTRGVPGFPDLQRLQFDDASLELLHRVLIRSSGQPFAATLDVETRWGQVDGETGLPSRSYRPTFKLFVDAPVVPDALCWGGNVQFSTGTAQNPFASG